LPWCLRIEPPGCKLVTYLHGISPPLRTAKLTAAHTIVTRAAVISQLLPEMLKK